MISIIPRISIIIVNYNGKDFLEECLNSVQKINFPKNDYEIIVVDNNSKDTSVDYIKKNFSKVQVIENEVNLGFAEGCNLGVNSSKGKYIVFLNTDTKVDPSWLTYLVNRIESDKKIAAVNSKMYLYYPFIPLSIDSDIFMRSEFTNSVNFQPVGVLIENVFLKDQRLQHLVRYSKGFYDKEKGLIPVQWTNGSAIILFPLNPKNELTEFTITIRSEKSSSNLKTKVRVKIGETILVEDTLRSYEVKQYNLSLKTTDLNNYFLYAVQNSGVVVFKHGLGRDRGAVVKTDHTNFYELDNIFFKKPCEIISFCGGSTLIKKDIFLKAGGFDESFFMYYEDVDLSLKLKRLGWKIYYEPKSVVHHIHAGVSGEWSTFFTFNSEKNHLAVVLKHFPASVFVKQFFLYIVLWIISILRMFRWRIKEHWELFDEWRDKVECRTNVILWVCSNMVQLIQKRLQINKTQKVSMKEIYQKLY
jgi:GT2 family glycosyltransferase